MICIWVHEWFRDTWGQLSSQHANDTLANTDSAAMTLTCKRQRWVIRFNPPNRLALNEGGARNTQRKPSGTAPERLVWSTVVQTDPSRNHESEFVLGKPVDDDSRGEVILPFPNCYTNNGAQLCHI